MEITTTPLTRAIEEIAAARGIGSLPELVGLVNDAGGDLSVEELYVNPLVAVGDELDRVLHTTHDERSRIVQGYIDTYFGDFLAKRRGAQA